MLRLGAYVKITIYMPWSTIYLRAFYGINAVQMLVVWDLATVL